MLILLLKTGLKTDLNCLLFAKIRIQATLLTDKLSGVSLLIKSYILIILIYGLSYY